MLAAAILAAWTAIGPVDLRWSAPAQCPTHAQVLERIDAYAPTSERSEEVRTDAVVSQTEQGWRLELTIIDARGHTEHRTLDDEDCAGLAEVTAVLTTLAITDAVAEPAEAPEDTPPEPPAIVPSLPPRAGPPTATPITTPPAPASQPADPPPVPVRWGLRVAGGLAVGWLPPGVDLGLGLTASRDWWAAEVEAQLGAPREIRLPRFGLVGADLLGWTVAGRGCGVVPLRERATFLGCGGLEAGQVRARAVGLDNPTSAAPTWLAGLVSPGLRMSLHRRVALWLMPELQLGVVRPQLHANGGELEVFTASIASGRLRGGAEIVF